MTHWVTSARVRLAEDRGGKADEPRPRHEILRRAATARPGDGCPRVATALDLQPRGHELDVVGTRQRDGHP